MSRLMEAAASLETRGLSFALGSVLSSYPDDGFGEQVLALTEAAGLRRLDEALRPLVSGGLDDLRSEYIDLFDRQQGHIPLYETEYGPGRSLAKGHDLADLAGFYHAFGVELADLEGSGRTELPDHVAVELEFYGYLLRKEAHLQSVHDQVGGEIVADARRKFLRDHLGGFLPSIAEQVAGTSSRTYQEIFAWCSALVRDECERMQAEPGALRARSGDPDEGELSCGALPIVR